MLAGERLGIRSICGFGDNWERALIFSDVRRNDPGTAHPRAVGGERDCPFYDYIAILVSQDDREMRRPIIHITRIPANNSFPASAR